jgi:hypothetical protein
MSGRKRLASRYFRRLASRRVRSGEREGQQARAQKSETARSQCKKSVGDQIAVAHDAPSDSQCSSELIKVFETSLFEKKLTSASGYPQMRGQEKYRRQPGPSVLSSSQTSQTSFAPRGEANDAHAYTVKKIPGMASHIPRDRGFCATDVPNPGSWFTLCPCCNHSLTTAKSSPFPPRSRCGILSTWAAGMGPAPFRKIPGSAGIGLQPVEW